VSKFDVQFSSPSPFPIGPRIAGREVVVSFDGGDISSDAGLLLLAEADRQLGMTKRLAECLLDRRQSAKVEQPFHDMLRQRVFGIACGYSDQNDFDALRSDPIHKLAVGRAPSDKDLASQPTLSRFENSVSRTGLLRMAEAMLDGFIRSHQRKPPREIILDADATDDPTHGQQELSFYHGYYECHCYLPLLVYAQSDGGEQELVASVLRPGNVHAGRGAVSILGRLVARLQAAFPDANIILRADSGLALPEVYEWAEEAGIHYAIGLAENSRLEELAEPALRQAKAKFEQTGEKAKLFRTISYAAESWPKERSVVVKAEVLEKGENPRFVVHNLPWRADEVYYFYTERGEVENRIKELKLDLESGRTSCHRFLANQFRLMLHAAAFVLMQFIRSHLQGTELAKAQCHRLSLCLLKVGARVRQSARRILLQLPSSYPWQDFWPWLVPRLAR